MKWLLVLRLSMIGLALALGSLFFISPNLEPLLWLGVFLFYAYAIGNGTRTLRFVHGLVLGIFNSFWVSAVHVVFLSRYLAGHPREVAMLDLLRGAKVDASPQVILSLTGLTVGFLEGIVIAVFSVVAGMMVRPKRVDLSGAADLLEPETEA